MEKGLDRLSDEDIMDLILQEDHCAFTELVTRHTSRFYSLAYRTLFDKVVAQDIVQDAFLKLWRDPHRWNAVKGVKFTTWFYKVTLNLCLDQNKRKRAYQLPDEYDVKDETSNLEGELSRRQKQKLVDKESRKNASIKYKEIKRVRQEVVSVLGAEIFNEVLFKQKLQELHQLQGDIKQTQMLVIVKLAGQLSLQERKALSKYLVREKLLKKKHSDRKP